jgi:antitoxin CptB
MRANPDRIKKLRWRSRSGMKELDVLFETFFRDQGEAIQAGDWPQLESLLDQEDDVLLDWVSGRNLPIEPDILILISKIKNVL